MARAEVERERRRETGFVSELGLEVGRDGLDLEDFQPDPKTRGVSESDRLLDQRVLEVF